MEIALLSLNVGMPKVIGRWHGEDVWSAIGKEPVPHETVFVGKTGIEGDSVADHKYHGGEDMAVYAYPAVNWPWWQKELQLACRPGLFGENLTLDTLDEKNVHIGDRFSWGDAVLEVSQPRVPCYKLGVYTDKLELAQKMTRSGLCGWYFRVTKAGSAPSKGTLTRIVCADAPTVWEAFTAVFARDIDLFLLQRIQRCPAVSGAWQRQVDKRIAAANR